MSSTEAEVISTKGHETFEPAFESDQVPRIEVPNLPEDAQGLTAKELAEAPQASAPKSTQEAVAPDPSPSPSKEVVAQSEGAASSVPVLEALDALPVLDEEHAQEIPVHVDTWIEVLQKRTEKLTDEIRELNARLDVLEKNQRVNHGGS
jgi:hypothetical protein